MSSNLTTYLDEALARQQDQEPLTDILAEFPDEAEALRPFLQTAAALETLQPVELPDGDLIAADRAIFMASHHWSFVNSSGGVRCRNLSQ